MRNHVLLSRRIEQIEGREWWLWLFAVVVTLALTFGIASFAFPEMGFVDVSEISVSGDWIRALAALVLLFDIYTIYQHIQLHRLRKQFAESNEIFQLISENAADMIAVVDKAGNSLYSSPSYERVLGYTADELRSSWAVEAIHPDDRERMSDAAAKARECGRGDSLEYRMRHKNGSWRILESTIRAVFGAHGNAETLVIVNRDITERRRAEELLEYNSLHDGLTHLPNRVFFLRRLEAAFAKSKRDSNRKFAVLFIDIDAFKVINDSLGYEAGDAVLIESGQRLLETLRAGDAVARAEFQQRDENSDVMLSKLASDEFAVFLDDISHPSDAIRVVERIQERIQLPFVIQGHEVSVTASVGITLFPYADVDIQAALRDAAIALHRAKSKGKGKYEIFDTAMHEMAVKRLQLETDIRKGVERDEFCVYYQPIVRLSTGRVAGFEALSRWDRGGQIVSPSEFIAVADETGLIIPINRKLLRKACNNLSMWRRNFPTDPRFSISVNIPARQFTMPNLSKEITDILSQTEIDPNWVELEIVETVAMSDHEQAVRTLTELNIIGVHLSIDDFGIGYSSLSRLQRLPIDRLKIDRSFIQQMDNPETREIIRTIILLGHSIGVEVVAEGVETESQLSQIKELGCDLAQGYLFSPPCDELAALNFLRNDCDLGAAIHSADDASLSHFSL